jgi:hypothetical protein
MEGMPIVLVMVCALVCVAAMNPKICLFVVLGIASLAGLYCAIQAVVAPLIPTAYAVIVGVAVALGIGIGIFLARWVA